MLSLGGLVGTYMQGDAHPRGLFGNSILNFWGKNYDGTTWTDDIKSVTWTGSGTGKPLITTTPTGYIALQFDGVNDQFVGDSSNAIIAPAGAGVGYYFYANFFKVTKLTATADQGFLVGTGNIEINGLGNNDGRITYGSTCVSDNSILDSNWHSLILISEQSTLTTRMIIDGVTQAATNVGTESIRTSLTDLNQSISPTSIPYGGFLGGITYGYQATDWTPNQISLLNSFLTGCFQ